MTDTKIRVSVIGGSGYAGGELLRLLSLHPLANLSCAVSETYAGKPLCSALSGFQFSDLVFERLDVARIAERSDVVFIAQENGFSMRWIPALLDSGCTVIDLAADFRLKSKELFSEWYKLEHVCPQLLNKAVYGLPEVNREELQGAKLVANPGCYPTASILALLPLLENDAIDQDSIVVDAKSGVSGAGRGKHCLDFHFPEVNESLRAYGVGGIHRHTPEIEQALSIGAKSEIRITFTPHLAPMTRGILATCYAKLKKPIGEVELHSLFASRYEAEPFVTVLALGAQPATKSTLGSNQCHLGIALDKRTNRAVITSALDNLVKGAAGQAIQNMNLACSLDETTGLKLQGVWP